MFCYARSSEWPRVPASSCACARRLAAAVRVVRAGDDCEECDQPRALGERRAQHRRARRSRTRSSQTKSQVMRCDRWASGGFQRPAPTLAYIYFIRLFIYDNIDYLFSLIVWTTISIIQYVLYIVRLALSLSICREMSRLSSSRSFIRQSLILFSHAIRPDLYVLVYPLSLSLAYTIW